MANLRMRRVNGVPIVSLAFVLALPGILGRLGALIAASDLLLLYSLIKSNLPDKVCSLVFWITLPKVSRCPIAPVCQV